MQLCCLFEVSFELQQSRLHRGLSRVCVLKVYMGVAMLCAVPAACLHGLSEDWCDDSTLVRPLVVYVRRIDPPVGVESAVAVARFYRQTNINTYR